MAMMTRRNTPLIDRFIEETLRNFGVESNGERHFALALDVHEDNNAYTISTALPGVNPEEIDVQLHDNVLTITAEVKREQPAEGSRTLIQERYYGRFSRSVRLPEQVKADAVEATYENGVLKLVVPKAEEAQPKQIRVKAGESKA